MSHLSRNNILNVIKLSGNGSNTNYSTFLGAPPQFWYGAKLGPWILLPAESRIELSEAFVIFIVILLTQFPTQHRYTDIDPDLRMAKIPYKAIPATGVHRGTVL